MPRRSLALLATALAVAGCATSSGSLTRSPEAVPRGLAPATEPSARPPEVETPPADATARSERGEEAPASAPEVAADAAREALRARLVARARSFLGLRGPFYVAGERFTGDCSGYVQAVYAAEGLALRELVKQDAPDERFAAKATWLAVQSHGMTFGADEPPAPGDLVFWHDTYDRDRRRSRHHRQHRDVQRQGTVNDFTHVGLVESVEDGTVHFLHRGWRGIMRGVMTLGRSHEATASDGRPLNSPLRTRSQRAKRGGLAAELFAGYARPDFAALEREGALAARPGRVAEQGTP